MKPLLSAIFLLLPAAALSHAQTPVFSFSFENTAQANNGIPSTVSGKIGFEPGMVGQAASFDGSTSIEIPHLPAFESPQFSISAWACPEQEKCSGRVLEKGASNSFWLTFYWGRARFGFWNPDEGYQEIDSATKFQPNEWHHLVGTFDGQTLRIYVDGRLEAMKQTTGAPSSNKQPAVLGAKLRGIAGDVFIGALDEIAFYDRALPETEILALFNQGN